VILTGQAPERPLIGEFIDRYRGPVADATGCGESARTAALLALCDLLVSNDTGVMHVGAAMGAPTVGIFGPAAARAARARRPVDHCRDRRHRPAERHHRRPARRAARRRAHTPNARPRATTRCRARRRSLTPTARAIPPPRRACAEPYR